jgi:hypothetical protein
VRGCRGTCCPSSRVSGGCCLLCCYLGLSLHIVARCRQRTSTVELADNTDANHSTSGDAACTCGMAVGSTVQTKHGNVNTDHILFICSGAFHQSKPSDMLAELQVSP